MRHAARTRAKELFDGSDLAPTRSLLARPARASRSLIAAACALALLALSAGPAQASASASFTTQGCSTWSVPNGVQTVEISAVGAAGGTGTSQNGTVAAGNGDGVAAALTVSPGQTLDVCVGVGGGAGSNAGAGAGGGASGVSVGSDFSHPVLVAAGGGGGAESGDVEQYVGTGGAAGQPGVGGNISGGGQPGTATGPGAGGIDPSFGDNGQPGQGSTPSGPGSGGNGYDGGCQGGGGGGGYYGGGGGSAGAQDCGGGGGGGGSDLCTDGASLSGCAVTAGEGTGTMSGSAAGDAQVVLTYSIAQAPAISFVAPTSGANYTQGQTVDSSFTCTDGTGGTGIASCVDQNGHASGTALDTSTMGSHTLTVTATSKDHLTASASITYTVTAAQPASIVPSPPTIKASLASSAFKAKTGTTIKLTLSATAAVKVRITHRVAGHRVGAACRANARKGKRCSLVRTVKSLQFSGVAGSNSLKLLIKSLKPGSYSVTISASNSGGTSNKATLSFKVKATG